ncbi:inner membrane protein AmpE [Legionella nautarum]|uniref:Inner membrane protein AmpE n=1 Tax=Legionella nautarum TaxID=45070 RepID=A0A0W0WV43_9GAMM|nr:regulatory signaling modulator protein AmpE [Legionella nautarum]KTD36185.1 inner membrane protein AmpE [Legionella nautarum]
MKLLVILLSLLSERYLVHAVSHLRFNWFPAYFNTLYQRLPKSHQLLNQTLILLAAVLPIAIICALLLYIFNHVLFGFIGFLLNLVIFYYCIGPENPFYPVREDTDAEHSELVVGDYFAKANGQLFAVIFWYIIFGALGALVYRLISLCRMHGATAQLATQITNILDWIPARITVILYLLVGNFQRGLHFFMQKFLSSPENNDIFLSEGGLLAARTTEAEPVQMSYAESLVEHAVIVYLVFIALFTLGALL